MAARPALVRFDVARNVDAGSNFESFLVAAVASILLIRLYLELTGYPQIGRDGLHIAHMLWGGLMMVVALVLLLAFLGKRVKRYAAVIGGIGFGAFIDELGKFITSDNDYFYQPTIGLIYVIFIGLFLLFRQIERGRELTERERLVNAADMIKEVILDGASGDEVDQALALLEQSGPPTELSAAIRQAVIRAERAAEGQPPLAVRLAQLARRIYFRLLAHHWFQRTIVLAFILNTLVTVFFAVEALSATSPASLMLPGNRSFVSLGHFTATTLASALTIVGLLRLVRSRPSGYRWFKRSVLISIFFVQFFLFVQNQMAALGGLAFNLVLLGSLNAMLHAELGRGRALESWSSSA
jgi:hypothetical protein